jgi:hypothetical protein
VTRDRKQIRLTAAGTRLLAHARTIEREFRLARSPAQDRRRSPRRCAWACWRRCPDRRWPLARALQGCGRCSWSKAAMPTCAAGWAKGNSTRSSRCFTARRMMASWLRRLCHAAAQDHPLAGRTMVSALDLAGDVMVAAQLRNPC